MQSAVRAAALLAAFLLPAFAPIAPKAEETSANGPAAPRSDLQECIFPVTPERRIKGCDAALADRRLSSADVAFLRYDRGLAELDTRATAAAGADLDAAIGMRPELWPARWVRAELRGSRRDYADAADDWSEVIRQLPEMAQPYVRRAVAYDAAGRGQEALAEFDVAALRAGAQGLSADDLQERAGVFEGMHQYDRAMADLSEAIRKDGQSFRAYASRGRIAFLTGNDDAALADFRKAGDLHPTDGYYLLWRYLAGLRKGNDASGTLRQDAASIDIKEWPGPIIEVLLGDRAAEQVKPPAYPPNWTEADRAKAATCELSFYQGEARLLRGERDKAKALFHVAVDSGIAEYIEYRAAAFELDRLVRR